MSLSISLASRMGMHLLPTTIKTTLANIERADTRLVVCLDEDDKDSRDYLDYGFLSDDRVIVSIEPQEDSLGEKYNRVLRIAPADVYLVMVDYAPFTTPGFDAKILRAAEIFPDDIGIIYNHLANLSFPEINAVTHRLAELMGGIYPPWFPYWFVDHWLDDIGRMIGRIVAVDVEIDAWRRPGTRFMREPAFWATLYDALGVERREIANRIMDAMWGSSFQKDMLRAGWPLIEERAFILNEQVRQKYGNVMRTPIDDRYARIKERAIVKMHELLDVMEAA